MIGVSSCTLLLLLYFINLETEAPKKEISAVIASVNSDTMLTIAETVEPADSRASDKVVRLKPSAAKKEAPNRFDLRMREAVEHSVDMMLDKLNHASANGTFERKKEAEETGTFFLRVAEAYVKTRTPEQVFEEFAENSDDSYWRYRTLNNLYEQVDLDNQSRATVWRKMSEWKRDTQKSDTQRMLSIEEKVNREERYQAMEEIVELRGDSETADMLEVATYGLPDHEQLKLLLYFGEMKKRR